MHFKLPKFPAAFHQKHMEIRGRCADRYSARTASKLPTIREFILLATK